MVGACVGTRVGSWVGFVGTGDGARVGATVESLFGVGVGFRVGMRLGADVVDPGVGAELSGAEVAGDAVGPAEGAGVGAGIGAELSGAEVAGDAVGPAEGTGVGASVGAKVAGVGIPVTMVRVAAALVALATTPVPTAMFSTVNAGIPGAVVTELWKRMTASVPPVCRRLRRPTWPAACTVTLRMPSQSSGIAVQYAFLTRVARALVCSSVKSSKLMLG